MRFVVLNGNGHEQTALGATTPYHGVIEAAKRHAAALKAAIPSDGFVVEERRQVWSTDDPQPLGDETEGKLAENVSNAGAERDATHAHKGSSL